MPSLKDNISIFFVQHAQVKRQQQYAQVKRQYLCFLAVIIALSVPTAEHHTLLAFSCHYLICTIRHEQDAQVKRQYLCFLAHHAQVKRQQQYAQVKRQYLCF